MPGGALGDATWIDSGGECRCQRARSHDRDLAHHSGRNPPGTTNGPEGPLSMRPSPTPSPDRLRYCLQAYPVEARSPAGRELPPLRVPPWLGEGAFSGGSCVGKGTVCSRGGLRGQVGAVAGLSGVRRQAVGSAGRRAGERAAAQARPSIRLSVCQCLRLAVSGQRGATRERSNFIAFFAALPTPGRYSRKLQVSTKKCASISWSKVSPTRWARTNSSRE